MSRSKGSSRKTNKTVRMPATKFPHLRKRLKKGAVGAPSGSKKGKRG